jgi:hypothetical protein
MAGTNNKSKVEDIIQQSLNKDVLLVIQADQLNLFGQTFRPIFVGQLIQAGEGRVTLWPVQIKMPNAPFYEFPTPLIFPLEVISAITDFDPTTRFSIS